MKRRSNLEKAPAQATRAKQPAPLKYIDRLFVHLLNRAGHAVSADFVRVLGDRGFTVRQWRVLGALWDVESLTLSELTEDTFCGNSTITRLIERLQDQGLVTRRPDNIDRRKTHVSLAPGAREQIRDLVELSETNEKAIIDFLGPDLVRKMMGELREMLVKLGEPKHRVRRTKEGRLNVTPSQAVLVGSGSNGNAQTDYHVGVQAQAPK